LGENVSRSCADVRTLISNSIKFDNINENSIPLSLRDFSGFKFAFNGVCFVVLLMPFEPRRGGTSVVCFKVIFVILFPVSDGLIWSAKDTFRFSCGGIGIWASRLTFGDDMLGEEPAVACERVSEAGLKFDVLPRGMKGVQVSRLLLDVAESVGEARSTSPASGIAIALDWCSCAATAFAGV
jgi:hypothetical protein